MCSDDAPPAPTADPQIGKAALESAATGRDALAYAKETGAAQTLLGQQALDAAKALGDKQADLGQQYLDFAKGQFAISTGLQQELADFTKGIQTTYLSMAQEDRDRYKTVFQPLEDEFIKTAQEWDTPEKQAEYAARAKSDVQAAAATERGALERRQESVGIRPDSGRFEGIDRAVGMGTALQSVGAQNAARDYVRSRALDLKTMAINLGQGLPARSAQELGAAASTAAIPLNAQLSTQGVVQPGFGAAAGGFNGQSGTTAQGYSTAAGGLTGASNTVASGTGAALGGLKVSGDLLNNQYKTDASVWDTQMKADQANAAGLGSFAGSALGLIGSSKLASGAAGLAMFSSKKLKENREDVPEGKSLDAVKEMPVQTYDYKEGVADGGSHVGPMAEDFQKATGKGDGMTIAVQDAIGVTMGAVKDLSSKVDKIAQAVGLGQQRKPQAA